MFWATKSCPTHCHIRFFNYLVLRKEATEIRQRYGKGTNKIRQDHPIWRDIPDNGAIRLQAVIRIDTILGLRCKGYGYQCCEIIRSLMSVYICGGSCVEDVTSQLMKHLSLHPTLRTCSSDTILKAIKELTEESISYTSDSGKTYDFNTADSLNTLLATGGLKEGEKYDIDFDHQFIEAEKYDAKMTYKHFPRYRAVVAVGGKERVFDEMNNGFGWNRLPKSFMVENTEFLLLTALIHIFYKSVLRSLDAERFELRETSCFKAFVFRFVSVLAK